MCYYGNQSKPQKGGTMLVADNNRITGTSSHEMPVSPWPEWKIVAKAGEGSYGSVYKAERSEHGHIFYSAIKVISIPETREELNTVLSEAGDENSAREYFENICEEYIREISMLESFRGNSHIVSVEDFKVTEYLDEIGWDIFIRMEYLTCFTEYTAGKSFETADILSLGADICKALRYLDAQKTVHRDIKPENIFVSRFGDYKLGDFGTARKMERSLSGFSKKGTESYMAPEVYRGEPYDARADIYSLGVVLYRLANKNRLPLVSLEKQLITYHDKEEALANRMAGEALPSPAEADSSLAQVILKACAYDPDERYQNASEMLEDLLRCSGIQNSKSINGPGKPDKETEKQNQESKTPDREPERPEQEADRTDREGIRFFIPWAAAVIAVALIVCVFVSIYIKKTLVNTVREQTEQMLMSIQARSDVPEEESGRDFASSIELISQRATIIVNELPEYTVKGTEGKVLEYYNDEGELRKVLVYPEESAEGVYEEYYYWNGDLFFAYIWDLAGEEMYYYRDGILIRWIDLEGNVHENEQDNEEYVERGDKYWFNSILRRGGS